jgi:hypothetical protein
MLSCGRQFLQGNAVTINKGKFTKIVFWIAAIYGFILLIPMYFLMNTIGQKAPPPISHPEFYYGFVGTRTSTMSPS